MQSNGQRIAAYIAGAPDRTLPPHVQDAARLCLADWLGVAVGAMAEDAGRIVRDVAAAWRSEGKATMLLGGTAAAPFAALANGTLAHCLDFDDTYVKAVTHTSAPVWAATLALGEALGVDEWAMLRAFVAGFETACRAGSGLGEAVTARGWHGTGVFGRVGAAAAAVTLLRLDAGRALHALGTAATQTGGLTASFGTMAKPFHAGKAAMDGVISAQLAARGFEGAASLLDPGGGLDNALVQDGSHHIATADFCNWEILQNSFKPYAACHLVHPAVDAVRALALGDNERGQLRVLRAEVGALAERITGGKSGTPATPLEGKFDLKYCLALALHGHELSAADFREPWRADPAVCETAGKIGVAAKPDLGFASARVEAVFADGRVTRAEVPVAKGHPGNPMTWDDMWRKFAPLVAPQMGKGAAERLFGHVQAFGKGAALPAIRGLLAGA